MVTATILKILKFSLLKTFSKTSATFGEILSPIGQTMTSETFAPKTSLPKMRIQRKLHSKLGT